MDSKVATFFATYYLVASGKWPQVDTERWGEGGPEVEGEGEGEGELVRRREPAGVLTTKVRGNSNVAQRGSSGAAGRVRAGCQQRERAGGRWPAPCLCS